MIDIDDDALGVLICPVCGDELEEDDIPCENKCLPNESDYAYDEGR